MSVKILPQPDDESCGPTSLHAVYQHYGLSLSLPQLIDDIPYLEEGGTLAVYLGIDALKRGFKASIYTSNLKVFDPTWASLQPHELVEKLKLQLLKKHGKKFTQASHAYIEFLGAGGLVKIDMISPELLIGYLSQRKPILTGLSATYLYQSKREYVTRKNRSVYNDIKGEPTGHFVVLYGTDEQRHVLVADPYGANPLGDAHHYSVEMQRLINAIHLGIVTYDANILIIEK